MLNEEFFLSQQMSEEWATIGKDLGTKGFKTNRENELGKYFARLQTQKLTDEE